MAQATIPLPAARAMFEALLSFVPYAQRDNAWAAALAIGVGYAYPPPKRVTTGAEVPP
jgi:hypothetical protein